MGKQQVWSVTAYVFLILSLASQIHCTSVRSLLTTISGVNQQEPKEKDLIKRLPGQPPVSFRQYGGYVAINETAQRFFYYYFVEAVKPSASSPLVLWLNGGPGCSSLGGGALTEHGPFRLHSDGKTLFRNPYAWNDEANVLYLESPAQIGFSYTNTPEDLKDMGDEKTAEDNYVFLVKWLEKFPEYKGRELFIAGQSYAGHYGPQLAQIVLGRNNQTFINLRGVLLGNPGLNNSVEADDGDEFLVSRALIPKEYLDDLNACDSYDDISEKLDFEKCDEMQAKMRALTENSDYYNIYAPTCRNATLTSKPKKGATVMAYDPCSEHYVKAYLNREKVQEAMHVRSTKLPYTWRYCNDEVLNSWNQTDKQGTTVPVLAEIIGHEGVRVLVYSGDIDRAVTVSATMETIRHMNLTVEKSWRQWFSGGQLAGITLDYKGNFTFATVRAAGHSVPTDQPIRALTLFTTFIRNTPLPSTI